MDKNPKVREAASHVCLHGSQQTAFCSPVLLGIKSTAEKAVLTVYTSHIQMKMDPDRSLQRYFQIYSQDMSSYTTSTKGVPERSELSVVSW